MSKTDNIPVREEGSILKKYAKGLLFLFEKALFEMVCPLCRRPMRSALDDPLCRECQIELLKSADGGGCRLCGNWISKEQALCGTCYQKPPAVNGFWAFGSYDGQLKELIKCYKYGEMSRLTPIVLGLIKRVYTCSDIPKEFDGVVIVPKYKPVWKTFFPMKRVAKGFCKTYQFKLLHTVIIKKKKTPPQAALLGRGRLENLKGAFVIRKGAALQGKKLLLLDDVSTTGSTIRYVAQVLRNAGAEIWVLVVAKAR